MCVKSNASLVNTRLINKKIHLKWSPYTWFNTLNPRGCSFRTYRHACFDIFKKSLTMTNSLSVNTLFSWCIILSFLPFPLGTKRIWPWPASLNFLVWRHNGHHVYLRWSILIGVAFFIKTFISDDIIDNK